MGAPELERYEVIEELGQGGMSVVYRARDRQLNREVALKVLHDFLARQEDARRRLHREAVAVAKLHHPGIVEIFDYSGPDAEPSYIVCELIRGRTLRAFAEQDGPIPHPELAALVTAELIRALRHAHERGIIHRDLKPENVMVTNDGRLKLMDFGIAQIMGGATRLTTTGTLLGSPAHMAPEMIDGQPSDHRSDIFSVGTILYWLATGALPFTAPNPSALFRQILEGVYEPAQAVQPRLGNGMCRIIERALATDPKARYQDISELQSDLNRELEAVDLLPIESNAKAYLSQPRPFADDFRPKLISKLAALGDAAMADGNVGRAMDQFNRVLAVEPDHQGVKAAVRKVGRKRALAVRLRRIAVSVAVVLVGSGLAVGLFGAWTNPAPEAVGGRTKVDAAGPRAALTPAPSPANIQPEPPAKGAPSSSNPGAKDTLGAGAPKTRGATVSASNRTAIGRSRDNKGRRTSTSTNPTEALAAAAATGTVTANKGRTAASRRFALLLRMHPGWADVSIDGRTVARGVYRAQLRLAPGRHEIMIENEYGRAGPRVIEVSRDGSMIERLDDGSRQSIKNELPIKTPGPAASSPNQVGQN